VDEVGAGRGGVGALPVVVYGIPYGGYLEKVGRWMSHKIRNQLFAILGGPNMKFRAQGPRDNIGAWLSERLRRWTNKTRRRWFDSRHH